PPGEPRASGLSEGDLMSMPEPEDGFSDDEMGYLNSAIGAYTPIVAHFATVSSDGQPDCVPIGYSFDGQQIYIGGGQDRQTRKFLNVEDGNTKVAFALDDSQIQFPRCSRFLRIYGTADIVEGRPVVESAGYGNAKGMGSRWYVRVTPEVSWS